MRYYVIINGVNSLTIEGLAIRTLPPISKPAMRNLREEIDGRDGDITTELGYGAYDRPLEIGLYGDYDINKIISFFNSKGTIIFSDEPDKYYKFEIVDKIDYTKLVKFRTATINIHCQPFKYPVSEEPQVEEYEYVEATGTNITLDNTSEAIFNKIDLLGNTEQDGTPTPSSPIPVNVVSGDNEINICGKNLYNVNDGESVAQEVVIDNDNWISVSYDNTSGSSNKIFNCRMKSNIFLKPDTTYKIVVEVKSISGNGVLTINEGANQQSQIYDGFIKDFSALSSNSIVMKNAKTWASLEGKSRLSTQYIYFSPGQSGSITFRVSLIEDTTLIPSTFIYEPYKSQSYSINLGTLELCKIGNYQDYFYKDSDKWYLHKEIGKVVLDGSENWVKHGSIASWFYYDGITNGYVLDNTQVLIKTNYYTPKAYQGVPNLVNGECSYGSSDSGITHRFVIKNTDYTQTNDFKNWLSTHNTIVYYVLATPTNILIEDTTLIEQLEAIKNAISYSGQTNVSQTNNDAPFILDLSALKEGSDHLVINNGGNIYAKPTIDIEGTGVVDIYLNDVQILEADLTENNNIVIDTEAMEAYNPDTNALANRQVTGDYSKIKLEPGDNDLRFSGDLSKATITDYTRWL